MSATEPMEEERGQEQLGSQSSCWTTTILDEGTEAGEVERFVWGCTASTAESEGKNQEKAWRIKSRQMRAGILAQPLN